MHCLFITLLFPLFAFGTIIEAGRFKEVVDHVTEDTWLILDIDNTILAVSQMLGSEEWFHHLRDKYSEIMPRDQALQKALSEWEAVRHFTKMELIEPEIADLIGQLQREGCCVMGLTAQNMTLMNRTYHQLKGEGVDLSLAAPSLKDCFFEMEGHGVFYRKGICFTSGKAKGEAFFRFCEEIKSFPKRIVFVDDKRGNVTDLKAASEKRGIDFVGLRYGYLDEKREMFSPKIAEIQFGAFQEILSDGEASLKLSENL
ncbi:MAG: hypothetical protein A3E80_05710 [Chlamydiae bacterium RIFCSPHIGHO2_12_FULL_49_9]|nr:MAG: hypothetical protein A3E80_05710 [Chlamydiae bacterium RIFCSPHIGHO2_12_FULL_49_9]